MSPEAEHAQRQRTAQTITASPAPAAAGTAPSIAARLPAADNRDLLRALGLTDLHGVGRVVLTLEPMRAPTLTIERRVFAAAIPRVAELMARYAPAPAAGDGDAPAATPPEANPWVVYERRKRAFDLSHPHAHNDQRDAFIAALVAELGI